MFAAAKKRVALAVSRAQKAHWAAYRKAPKGKAEAKAKTPNRIPQKPATE
jgi:hypothetical protein